jgi:ABC-type lipoprotein release transport system permease subunit
MDPIWKIASRNVIRNRKRTLITCVVMTVGIGLYIGYDSVLAGMDRLTIDTMVSYSSSSLKVRTSEYAEEERGSPLEYGLADPKGTMEAIRKAAPEISAVTPRTLFVAQVSNYTDSEPLIAAAVDPAADGKVFKVASAVGEGSWLSSNGDHEAVVAASVAKELGLKLGDGVLLSARTVYENDNADEYRVVGIVGSSASLSGTASVYLSYSDAKALLGAELPVTEIDAALARAGSLDAELSGAAKAAAKVRAALPGLSVAPVGEAAKDYLALRNSKDKASLLLVVMILLIAAVGIVNTILMSVYSRVREIGVLRAYGMTQKDIRQLFTREGLIIGALGSLAGLALGALIDWFFTAKGLNIAAAFGNMDLGSIPVNATLYGEWRPQSFAVGFLFGILVSWLSARFPAKRAAKLEPTDALRFV